MENKSNPSSSDLSNNSEFSAHKNTQQRRKTIDQIKSGLSKTAYNYFLKKQYLLLELLGHGAFGVVFRAQNITTKILYAIKIELKKENTESILLTKELSVYKSLLNNENYPKIISYGTTEEFSYMIMSHLGDTLETIRKTNDLAQNLSTLFFLASKLINLIAIFHSTGYVHRDIKPENFVIGFFSNVSKIYLIDYGLSKKYICDSDIKDLNKNKEFINKKIIDPSEIKHIKKKYLNSFIGTARYASINAHKGFDQSRRDDLISLGYLLVFLNKGILPWNNLEIKDPKQKWITIKKIKAEKSNEELCKGLHPNFLKYLNYVTELEFEAKPDYSFLIELFKIEDNFIPCWFSNYQMKYIKIAKQFKMCIERRSFDILEKKENNNIKKGENYKSTSLFCCNSEKNIGDNNNRNKKNTKESIFSKNAKDENNDENWGYLDENIQNYNLNDISSDIPFEIEELNEENPCSKIPLKVLKKKFQNSDL